MEEPGDLDPAMAYYQLDNGSGDAVFTSLPVRKGNQSCDVYDPSNWPVTD